MARREYDRIDRVATYRVKVTLYGDNGSRRKRQFLVPANSNAEAEQKARAKVGPSKNGYTFDTKRVADYWREQRD
jgi:hypothetical protein